MFVNLINRIRSIIFSYKASFITTKFMQSVESEGRLLEAIESLKRMPEKQIVKLGRLNNISAWECVLEEVVDTDHEIEYYCKFVNELYARGYTEDHIREMRKIAWETAGWFNYEMMAWDWCGLDEKDMKLGLEDKYSKRVITSEEYRCINKTIEKYRNAPKNGN